MLIKPAKSETGKISKLFTENMNTKIRELSLVHQWKDLDAVRKWFFVQFEIEDLYPSVSKGLLLKSGTYE